MVLMGDNTARQGHYWIEGNGVGKVNRNRYNPPLGIEGEEVDFARLLGKRSWAEG